MGQNFANVIILSRIFEPHSILCCSFLGTPMSWTKMAERGNNVKQVLNSNLFYHSIFTVSNLYKVAVIQLSFIKMTGVF